MVGCRALDPLADHQSDRERVRHGAAQDGADQGIGVAADRQADGVQTDRCGVQNLASIERHKSVAEDHRWCQFRRRHRGRSDPAKPRRLIGRITQIQA
jgi:hypothetical protein